MPELVEKNAIEDEWSVARVRSHSWLHAHHKVRLIVLKGVLRISEVKRAIRRVLLTIAGHGDHDRSRKLRWSGLDLQTGIRADSRSVGALAKSDFRIAEVRILEALSRNVDQSLSVHRAKPWRDGVDDGLIIIRECGVALE